LAIPLQSIDWIGVHSRAVAFTIVVLLITFLTLILGELVPKRLALNNPEKIAIFISGPMGFIAKLAHPVVRLLSLSTDAVLRLFGIHSMQEQPISEEEIRVMIDQGIEAGTVEEAERDMIESVFSLGDKRVGALMAPRTDVMWLDIEDNQDEIIKEIEDSPHSRFPVCQGDLDNVLGIVRSKDLLNSVLKGEQLDLRKWLKPPLFVPESAPVLKVLETMKKAKQHVSMVVDEYGVIQGFITVYDILEAIVGDIPSADEIEEPMAVQRKDGSWLIDGLLPLDDFKEIFNIRDDLPEQGTYQTVGGFIMMHLGRIPAAADYFEWDGLKFEVMDMDGNRIDKVLIMPMPEENKIKD
jgi:putative hemolysin